MSLSSDGRWWWDGRAWRPVGPDGRYYHDGTGWLPVPGATGSPPALFRAAAPKSVRTGDNAVKDAIRRFVGLPLLARIGIVAASLFVVAVAAAAATGAGSSKNSGGSAAGVASSTSSREATSKPAPSPTAASTPTSTTVPTAAAAAAPSGPTASSCVPNPMEHVYNPDRLRVLNPCVTVSGTIALVRSEADGDFHVRMALDPGQLCAGQDCLNDINRSQQAGDLIVEPVCEHSITQADAMPACSGYHNPLVIPPVGTHTTVTGPWVLDLDHGWNEIHPAENFGGQVPTSTPATTPTPSNQAPVAALTLTITASQYGYVAASTAPGATCSATARLPSGRASTASGLLVQQTAGPEGGVSWSYGTSSRTAPGTGTHTVTCTLGGQTRTATAPFSVP